MKLSVADYAKDDVKDTQERIMRLKMTLLTTGCLSILACAMLAGCGTNSNASSNSTQPVASNSAGQGPNSGNAPSHRMGFGGGANLDSLAKVLKISTTTLSTDLKNGDSLEQIAQKQGVSQKTLISDLESSFKSQISSAVSSGHMSSSQEQQMISRYDSNVSKMIEQKGFAGFGRGGGGHSGWSGKWSGNKTTNSTNS